MKVFRPKRTTKKSYSRTFDHGSKLQLRGNKPRRQTTKRVANSPNMSFDFLAKSSRLLPFFSTLSVLALLGVILSSLVNSTTSNVSADDSEEEIQVITNFNSQSNYTNQQKANLVPIVIEVEPEPEVLEIVEFYEVKTGDSLLAIARKFDMTIQELVEINDIKDPSKLQVGQMLRLIAE